LLGCCEWGLRATVPNGTGRGEGKEGERKNIRAFIAAAPFVHRADRGDAGTHEERKKREGEAYRIHRQRCWLCVLELRPQAPGRLHTQYIKKKGEKEEERKKRRKGEKGHRALLQFDTFLRSWRAR